MYTIKQLQTMKENQTFDRKSIRIEPKALATPFVAFANADGGTLAIGIKDNGKIEGIKGHEGKINEFLLVGYDFCKPTIKVEFETLDCIDSEGKDNQVLLIKVHQSQNVHTNQADEVFYRVGDKSKKLSFEERLQLMYDKDDRFYEDSPVKTSTIDDIDMDKVKDYASLIGYSKTLLEFLTDGKKFITKTDNRYEISGGAILLFGKNPQHYFPRARVRFIKYQGVIEKTGTRMNVIKDIIFEGTILEMLQKSLDFVGTQIKEFTKLGNDGKFHTKSEYPEFVWKEIIVNAVCHRDYSIKGTDIQIKMFDDRLVVESPRTLPGLVRLDNMRNIHFSRNPKIAGFLKDHTYVKEFGEGIDRMFIEMEAMGLPAPKYEKVAFMTKVTVKNNAERYEHINEHINEHISEHINLTQNEKLILDSIINNPKISQNKLSEILGVSKSTVRRATDSLKEKNIIERVGSNKGGYWKIIKN
ncbi:MAG: putative DNA binding domain-containing protein [Firmicutes bacterium]|nr:putative DNA binding domain-containing protein [Bacillota bacterium]